jgi:Ca2+-binding EF-hand superfamily protein
MESRSFVLRYLLVFRLIFLRERIFSLLDANNSGRIEFSEFLVGMSIISDGIDDDQLISLAFKSIDYNSISLFP